MLISRFLPRERREAYTRRCVTRQSVFCENPFCAPFVNKCKKSMSRKFIRGGPLPPANPCDVAEAVEADVTRGPLPPLLRLRLAVGRDGIQGSNPNAPPRPRPLGPYAALALRFHPRAKLPSSPAIIPTPAPARALRSPRPALPPSHVPLARQGPGPAPPRSVLAPALRTALRNRQSST